MDPRDRQPYSALPDRPALRAPGGARVLLWPIVNVEVWDPARPMPRQVLPPPTGQAPLPDVPNWSWHEYGMRVGIWRLLDLFAALDVRPTLSVNGRVVEAYPRVAAACRDAGWEFMAHGWDQRPIHLEPDQPAMIARTLDALEACTGVRPTGWLGPGLTQTLNTPDHLVAAGVRWIGDWVHDDEPTVLTTRHGPLVTLPYSVECNDIPIILVQHHTAAELAVRIVETFDRLHAEGAARVKILAVAVHPYISGVPHRIGHLERALRHVLARDGVLAWQGGRIYEWFRGERPQLFPA